MYSRNEFNVSEFVRNFNLINIEEMMDSMSEFVITRRHCNKSDVSYVFVACYCIGSTSLVDSTRKIGFGTKTSTQTIVTSSCFFRSL